MPLAAGTRLGAYEILSPLGAGGMGEVYRARDTKLNRDVAIKVLPELVSGDSERLARFHREAHVLAALNHPNIAAIYGFEDSGGVHALVLELVDGPTLADRIAQGAIPIREALPMAKQIAEALEAAHEQGIIHRDLKPANIKLRNDGTIKILDFGLAKLAETPGIGTSAVALSRSPTITTPAMTMAGVILGTAAYMSPEQAKGQPADKRSDIWAFGCVLFEMLSGTRAFDGEDVSDTLATVLKGEPNWRALPADTPPTLRRLLQRCLAKDRRARVPDTAVARFDIDDILNGSTPLSADLPIQATSGAARWRGGRGLPIAVTAIIAVLLGGVATRIWTKPARQSVLRLTATPIDGSSIGDGSPNPDVAITPDGTRIIYAVGGNPLTGQLFVRSLDALDPTSLKMSGVYMPFVSFDGQWLGYFDFVASSLKKVAITGGPPVTICTVAGLVRGATWGSDGTIVFSGGGELRRVGDGGGSPVVLAKPDRGKGETVYTFPEILPGNRAVLFTIMFTGAGGDNSEIAVRDLRTGETKVLVQGGRDPHYSPSGYLVFAAAGSLRAVRFDVDRLAVDGTPVPIVDRVSTKGSGEASFALARNGTLVYRAGDNQGAALRTLVWVDRQGHEESLGMPARAYAYTRISPDGTKLALDIRDQENDIWTWDLLRHGPLTRLTVDPGMNRGGVWSRPDGKRIAFSAERDGVENIYWQAADGTGMPERLTDRPGQQAPQSFTPDGTQLLFDEPAQFPFDIGVVNLTGERHADLLLHGPQSEHNGDISPDGKWLAYESDESRQAEVYVRPFPNVDASRQQVSIGGGSRPVWARNGRELFYEVGLQGGSTAKIMAVSVQPGSTLTFGTPQVVVDGSYLTPQAGRPYDVSLDGKRLLMIKDATPTSTGGRPPSSQLIVVLNWDEELKAKVPPK